MSPSQPGFGWRILSGKQSVGLQFRENETVDVVLRPGVRLDCRRGEIFDRLPAPLFRATLLQLHGKIYFLFCPRRTGFGRPGQPVGDPLLEIGNHGCLEFAFRWHLEVGIAVMQGLQQETLPRMIWIDRSAKFPPEEHAVTGIEIQSAFQFFRVDAVATVTFLDQHRTDALFEKLELLPSERRRFLGPHPPAKQRQHGKTANKERPVAGVHGSQGRITQVTRQKPG